MSNLLKEAIADAKTVRETAIANAKMALEEAFTPHLKSMLSAKLAEEDDEEDNDEGMHDNDEMRGDEEEGMHGDEEEGMHDNDEGEHEDEEEGMHDNDEGEHEDEEEGMREEDIIEIDGVKYAPIVSEEDDEEDEDAEEMREDEELDLESVIKELETEIAESENDDDLTEGDDEDEDDKDEVKEEEELDEDKDEVDEQSKSSGIGAGDNKVNKASAGDEEDPGKGKEMKESVNAMQKELNEYKEAVTFLREKLHEVNILNAKLLYTNRLFKEYVLSNDQKLKIVETFDRAQTTREIKLVYTTLAESFKNGDVKKGRVQESASKKSGTTKPTQKIITEESKVADRFKKLAGIL